MICQLANYWALLGVALFALIFVRSLFVIGDFYDYCRRVAQKDGKMNEINSPVHDGEGFSRFEAETFYGIWNKSYERFDDPTLVLLGERIRRRFVYPSKVWAPLIFLFFLLPALLLKSLKWC
jgi:hypothetical protein